MGNRAHYGENCFLNQIAVQVLKIILALLNINFNCSHLIKFQFYSYCPIWVKAPGNMHRKSVHDTVASCGSPNNYPLEPDQKQRISAI